MICPCLAARRAGDCPGAGGALPDRVDPAGAILPRGRSEQGRPLRRCGSRLRKRRRPVACRRPGARPGAGRGRQYVDCRRPAGQGRGCAGQGAGRQRACRPSSMASPCSTGPARPKPRTTSRPPAPRSTKPPRRSARIPICGSSPPRSSLREEDVPAAKSSINRALAMAPDSAEVLFEAGHIAKAARRGCPGPRLLDQGDRGRSQRPDRQSGARSAGDDRRSAHRHQSGRDATGWRRRGQARRPKKD